MRWQNQKEKSNSGYALVSVIIITLIAMTIAVSAISILGVNSISATQLSRSVVAYDVAESGVENALLQLIRNPSYTGEVLTVGEGVAEVTVSPGSPLTVLSVGRVDNFQRSIQVTLEYNGTTYEITSWRELP